MTDKPKRGFAAFSKDFQLECARRGGHKVPAHKRSFSRNNALAIAAGRKGGLERQRRARLKP